jgi:predicted kinase
MGPHVVAVLRQGLSVSLDFQANTVQVRAWMHTLIAEAGVAHELHLLDVPDEMCRQRLRARNAGGEHPYQVSDADYDQFTRYFVPPAPDEGFNVIVHTP